MSIFTTGAWDLWFVDVIADLMSGRELIGVGPKPLLISGALPYAPPTGSPRSDPDRNRQWPWGGRYSAFLIFCDFRSVAVGFGRETERGAG
jgi:hypothetical protein